MLKEREEIALSMGRNRREDKPTKKAIIEKTYERKVSAGNRAEERESREKKVRTILYWEARLNLKGEVKKSEVIVEEQMKLMKYSEDC